MRGGKLLLLLMCLLVANGSVHSQSFTPRNLPGLRLWLSSDTGITTATTRVTAWADRSGNNSNATSPGATTTHPTFVSAVAALGNRPVVRFSGTQYMRIASFVQAQPLTTFVVWKSSNTTALQHVYDGANSSTDRVIFRYSANTNPKVIDAFGGSFIQYTKTTFPQYIYSSIVYNGDSGKIFENGVQRVVGDLDGSRSLTALTIGGRQDLAASNFLNGDIAEIIFYSRVLTDAERSQVELYLKNKYAPPVSLGNDTIINNVCPHPLNAQKDWFTAYEWNTMATTSSIVTNKPDTYWVEATDIFGSKSRDTIVIRRPIYDSLNFNPLNRTICLFDSIRLSAGNLGGYSYLWTNGKTTPSIYAKDAGQYAVRITDGNSCSITTDTVKLTLDSLPANASLGNDTSLCAGNQIGLQKGIAAGQTYLWSTADVTPTITVNTSGAYRITISNSLGCLFKDTINVIVSGVAPATNFQFDTVCSGTPTSFQNLTPSVPSIDSLRWDFGNGQTSTLSNPSFIFPGSGTYNVTLKTYGGGGCLGAKTLVVPVYANPVANFNADTVCNGIPVDYSSTSTSPLGQTIVNWQWNINSQPVAATVSFQYTYSTVGNNDVQLTIATDKGCVNSTTKQVAVVPANASLPLYFSLTSPQDNFSTTNPINQFRWQSSVNAVRYKVKISSSQSFSSLLIDTSVSTTSVLLSLPLSSTPYYWTVYAFNRCGDSIASTVRMVSIFSPGIVANQSLWLSADTGYTVAGSTATWADRSGNNAAVTSTGTVRPTLTSGISTINNSPVVRFAGTQYMRNLAFAQGQPLTSFVVWKSTATSGVQHVYDGANSSTDRIILRYSASSSPKVVDAFGGAFIQYTKATFPQYIFSSIVYNGDSGKLYENSVERVVGDVDGSRNLTALTIGARQDLAAGNHLTGDIAEILFYNRVLTDVERSQIELYIRNKYAPAVNLGNDTTIASNFCPYTINAQKDWYASYLWSNNATTPNIVTTKGGTFWVEVTDIFGFKSRDTIVINRPAFDSLNFTPLARKICLGDSVRLSTGLQQGVFHHIWTNGDTIPTVYAKNQGNYAVLITDNAGCSYSTDTVKLTIDSLTAKATLGADTTLCAGNKIGLQAGMVSGLSYLWSTGDTTPLVTLSVSNVFELTVSSTTGCVFRDTISVTVRGQVPTPSFTANDVCLGVPTLFQDQSTANGSATLTNYLWEFGDDSTSTQSSPAHTYLNFGLFNVKLTVTNSDTCTYDTIIPVVVLDPPSVAFDADTACQGRDVLLLDQTTVQSGQTLAQWNWDFGDQTISSLQSPLHQYVNIGTYNIKLKVTTDKGCIDSLEKPIEVIVPLPAPQFFDTYSPSDSFFSTTSLVNFKWNPSLNSTAYNVQVSKNSNFTSLVLDTLVYTISGSFNIPFFDSLYSWRVLAVNPCGDVFASASKTLSVFSLHNIQGLSMWVKADSGIVVSGTGFQWSDASGSNHHLLQNGASTKRPSVVSSVQSLNSKPVVRFNGTTQFLRQNNFIQTQPLTSFVVWRSSSSTATQHIFDGVNTINRVIFRLSAGNLSAFAGKDVLYTKSIPFAANNYLISTIKYDGANSSLAENTSVVSVGDIGTNTLAGITVGARQDTVTTASLGGDIAEMIFVSAKLNEVQTKQVETYLRTKYAPPVNLGPDIRIPYGACDTVIRIKNHFVKTLWSTGDTNIYSIKIKKSGVYWVRATDAFGFVSSDTVTVNVPYSGINPGKDTIVCANNSVLLSFGINGAPYSFNWSTGDTGTSNITVNQTGDYFVVVSDTNGCALTSDTISIAADSLEYFSVLDDDTVSCTNSPLALFQYLYPYQSYSWSTGGTNDTIMIPGPGKIYVTVTDVNGCSTKDSININVKGYAPVVDFTFQNICLGDTTFFTDLSTADTTFKEHIVKWNWTFGQFAIDTVQNPAVVFPNSALYEVSLYAETDSGCNATRIKDVQLGARPSPFISFNIACANSPVTLNDASTIPIGDTVKFWNWLIEDNNYTTKNVTYEFPSVGSYPVKLVVVSAKGCVDSTTANVEIFPAINPDFMYENQCVGNITIFTDTTPSFSIIKRIWRLSDQAGIINDSISFRKEFAMADTFRVTLEVTNAIGCKDTVVKNVVIYPTPTPQIIDSIACIGSEVTLTENSQSLDSIVRYEWLYLNRQSVFRNPTFIAADTGVFPIQLKVTSVQGCIDSTTKNFRVIPLPVAQFGFTPFFGEAPLEVSFTNGSKNASGYEWDFGDGVGVSNILNPIYTYTINDTFSIRLIASNSLGCTDSAYRNIVVTPTDADIELVTINTQTQQLLNGAISANVIARYVNVGTQPIVNAQLLARLDNGTTILDNWTGLLYPGESLIHTFSSSFYLSSNSVVSYVCVDAVNVNNGSEENLDNNRNCRALNDNLIVTNLYPNPASGEIKLDLILPDEEDFKMEVSNEIGQKLIPEFEFNGVRGANTVRFNVNAFRPGIYFLKIKYRENTEVQKFQVIR